MDLTNYQIERTSADGADPLAFTVYDGAGVAIGTEFVERAAFNMDAIQAECDRLIRAVVRREALDGYLVGRRGYGDPTVIAIREVSGMGDAIYGDYRDYWKPKLFQYVDARAAGTHSMADFVLWLGAPPAEEHPCAPLGLWLLARTHVYEAYGSTLGLVATPDDATMFALLKGMSAAEREAL